MKALMTTLAVAVALMLAGCGGGGGSSPLAGMPDVGTEPVARVIEGGGSGPVERVGEGDGTPPVPPGGGSEGDGTGAVARVIEDGGSEGGGASWAQFLERLGDMGWGVAKGPFIAFDDEAMKKESRGLFPRPCTDYGNTGTLGCTIMKHRIARGVVTARLAGTELPSGPERRFHGIAGVTDYRGLFASWHGDQTNVWDGDRIIVRDTMAALEYWGGWQDNSVFYAGTVGETPIAQSVGLDPCGPPFDDSLRPLLRDEFVGVYRGRAVDMEGNWGTSEVSLSDPIPLDEPWMMQMDLTIDIQPYGGRSWRAEYDHYFMTFQSKDGDSRMKAQFYHGKEVGGVFQFPHSGDLVMGAFGAKKVQ